jgi:hypothetical protein
MPKKNKNVDMITSSISDLSINDDNDNQNDDVRAKITPDMSSKYKMKINDDKTKINDDKMKINDDNVVINSEINEPINIQIKPKRKDKKPRKMNPNSLNNLKFGRMQHIAKLMDEAKMKKFNEGLTDEEIQKKEDIRQKRLKGLEKAMEVRKSKRQAEIDEKEALKKELDDLKKKMNEENKNYKPLPVMGYDINTTQNKKEILNEYQQTKLEAQDIKRPVLVPKATSQNHIIRKNGLDCELINGRYRVVGTNFFI